MKLIKWYITKVDYKKKYEYECVRCSEWIKISFSHSEKLKRIRDLCSWDNYGDFTIPIKIKRIIDDI